MLTTLRPYTKVVTVTADTKTVIDLKDSAGNSLDCNYITVDASGSNANQDFFVYLSSIPGLTNPETPTGTVNPEVSGFCGVMGSAPGIKPVEIFLDNQDRVNKITIYCQTATLNAVVTYGNIHVANALRFNDTPKGS